MNRRLIQEALRLVVPAVLVFTACGEQAGDGGQFSETDGQGGQAVVLRPGLPEFSPLARLGLLEPLTTPLDVDDGELFFVVGMEESEKSLWLLRRFANGPAILSRAREGWNPVMIVPETEESRMLHLTLSNHSRELHYVWGKPFFPSGFQVGEGAPDLDVTLLSGGSLRLSALRGKTVVLNWWAISCVPCIEEIPELSELVRTYEREPVEFVAIAHNTSTEVREFLKSREFLYEQAVANAGTAEILGNGYPRHIVVAPDGTVVYNSSGFGPRSLETLGETLTSVLNGC